MKMRDLERLTGVNRETVRVYLREGLLPEPRRSARNVADYGEEHVRGIEAIRRLQAARRLTLPQIKRALRGEAGAVPAEASVLRELQELLDAKMGLEQSLVPLDSILMRNERAAADARALQAIGAVRVRRRKGQTMLTQTDAQLVALWGDMRAAGFTEAHGFQPGVVKLHVQAAERLARQEVRAFLAGLDSGNRRAPAGRMVDTALSTMLAFFGLIRARTVLEQLRATAQRKQGGERPARGRTAIAQTRRRN